MVYEMQCPITIVVLDNPEGRGLLGRAPDTEMIYADRMQELGEIERETTATAKDCDLQRAAALAMRTRMSSSSSDFARTF